MKLETSRLSIRPLRESDWRAMKVIFTDFSASPYAVYDHPMPSADEAVKALTKWFADTNLFFAVFLQGSEEMMGYVCFHKVGEEYDLGYCFHSAFHGKGYAHESVTALLRLFAEEYGAAGFTAGTALDNKPSCALLEKLGFSLVSTETVSFDRVFSFPGGNFRLDLG